MTETQQRRTARSGATTQIPASPTGAPSRATLPPGVPNGDFLGDEPTTYDRYRQWIKAHPEVLDALIRLARLWVDRFGRRHLGVRFLVERCRWEMAFTSGDPDFKINNNYCPFIAREIAERAPDLDGVFATRSSMADRHYGIVRWPGSDIELSDALW